MSSSIPEQLRAYAEAAVQISSQAGDKILEIYNSGFDVETKGDGSPVTTADHLSHSVITEELARLTPNIPVLSEESAPQVHEDRHKWSQYWLIDPLDGTKEFIHRRGDFTVNIALINNGKPVVGVVHTPVQELFHWAWEGGDAYRRVGQESPHTIHVRRFDGIKPTVVASRSHGRGNLELFLQSVKRECAGYELTSMGSALKICIVAEGHADVYPRLGLTSEWDTAAAHCVLDIAGGSLLDLEGEPLRYNKESILNPWFIASGTGTENWHRHLAGVIDPG